MTFFTDKSTKIIGSEFVVEVEPNLPIEENGSVLLSIVNEIEMIKCRVWDDIDEKWVDECFRGKAVSHIKIKSPLLILGAKRLHKLTIGRYEFSGLLPISHEDGVYKCLVDYYHRSPDPIPTFD